MTYPYPPLAGPPEGASPPAVGDVLYYDGSKWVAGPASGDAIVPTSRAINTTDPLHGGGDLSADRTLTFAPAANVSMGSNKLTSLAAPTAGTDAANKNYVDQIPSRSAAAGVTVGAADIGGAIHLTGAGAQAIALPDLSASLISGKSMVILFVQEGAATQGTITPAGGNINGGATLVLTAGYGTRAIVSRDGLNWFG